MLTRNIPDLVAITVKPYGGEYNKRRMAARDLYCWFNNAQPTHPHVSITCDYMNEPWTYFHVTFPCYVLDRDRSSAEEEVLQQVSYSIHFVIDDDRDVVAYDPKTKDTGIQGWKAPKIVTGNNWVSSQGRAGMREAALPFAREFFASAFFQSKG